MRRLRAHLHAIAACCGTGYITQRACVPEHVVRALMAGDRQRVTHQFRRSLMMVSLDHPRAMVASAGFLRRVDDLALRGFSGARLGALLGVTQSTLSGWVRLAYSGRVRAHEAARIAALFVLLEGRVGSSVRTAAIARGRGAVPAVWWGDGIDDPGAVVNPDNIMRCV